MNNSTTNITIPNIKFTYQIFIKKLFLPNKPKLMQERHTINLLGIKQQKNDK